MKRRTTEITIEIESLLQMRWLVSANMGQCMKCQRFVTLVTLQEAEKIANQWLIAISLLLEGRIHMIESNDGTASICLDSLLAYLEEETGNSINRSSIGKNKLD